MSKKTLCYIFSVGDRFKSLAKCAGSSFRKWHPRIDVKWEHFSKLSTEPVVGLAKFKYAYKSALEGNYDKVIILGADTITCSYLDEFFNNDEDILCTLDYPYPLETQYVTTPPGDFHVNADVVCFNNIKALNSVIELAKKCPTHFCEQGALNQLLHHRTDILDTILKEYTRFTYLIVDGPYDTTPHIYNARSKGNINFTIGDVDRDCYAKYTTKMYVKDNKLFSFDDKQIKVWHYCDGLGSIMALEDFKARLNNWITNLFNNETKQFFTTQCACGEFYK
jgi:hypothetical protein